MMDPYLRNNKKILKKREKPQTLAFKACVCVCVYRQEYRCYFFDEC